LVSLLGTTGFTFWLYNRLAFGTFRYFGRSRALLSAMNVYFYDLTRLEFGILFFFSLLTLMGGLFPGIFLVYLDHGLFYYFV